MSSCIGTKSKATHLIVFPKNSEKIKPALVGMPV